MASQAVIQAAQNGDATLVKLLLDSAGVDLDARDDDPTSGATALIWAAANGHPAPLRTLLESGLPFDLELKCLGLGRSALHWAVAEASSKAVSMLLRRGANSQSRCSAGWTPLCVAAYSATEGHVACAQLLLLHGAKDVPDADGGCRSALSYAQASGSPFGQQILRLLQRGGSLDKPGCRVVQPIVEPVAPAAAPAAPQPLSEAKPAGPLMHVAKPKKQLARGVHHVALSSASHAHVLVTGGSGYLGQFLVSSLLACGAHVVSTYSRNPIKKEASTRFSQVKLELAAGKAAITAALAGCGPFDSVVNCAAISSPGQCEANQALAKSINVPTDLLEVLREHPGRDPFFVQLSTDQVFDGTMGGPQPYKEDEPARPVNIYGRSKLEAEQVHVQ